MNNKEFGKKVAALRKEKGLTQSELADKLNISNKAISRWETGEGYPEITILAPLAKELGVTVDELLNDSCEKDAFEENYDYNSADYNSTSEYKQNEDIPLEKPYWKSLTIFNKIGVSSLLIIIASLALYGIILFTGLLFSGIPSFLFFIPVFIYGIAALIGKAGLIATIIGLIAGFLNLYNRQIKVSIILTLILFVATYVLPLVMVSFGAIAL